MTATYTSRLGLRKVDTDVAIDVNADFNDVMDRIDAAVGFEPRTDFPASPFIGKCVQRTDQVDSFSHGPSKWVWDGTAWIEVYDASQALVTVEGTTQTRTGSIAYTAGSPECSRTFNAPGSGIIAITIMAGLESTGNGIAGVSVEVRETNSSGALVISAIDKTEVSRRTNFYIKGQYRTVLTGLTPYAQYFARTMHRSDPTTETASIWDRKLIIERE